jgi:hypothetical protein
VIDRGTLALLAVAGLSFGALVGLVVWLAIA